MPEMRQTGGEEMKTFKPNILIELNDGFYLGVPLNKIQHKKLEKAVIDEQLVRVRWNIDKKKEGSP